LVWSIHQTVDPRWQFSFYENAGGLLTKPELSRVCAVRAYLPRQPSVVRDGHCFWNPPKEGTMSFQFRVKSAIERTALVLSLVSLSATGVLPAASPSKFVARLDDLERPLDAVNLDSNDAGEAL